MEENLSEYQAANRNPNLTPEEKFELALDAAIPFLESTKNVWNGLTTKLLSPVPPGSFGTDAKLISKIPRFPTIAKYLPVVKAGLIAKEGYDIFNQPDIISNKINNFRARNEALKARGYAGVIPRMGLILSNPLHTAAAIGEDVGDGLYNAYQFLNPENPSLKEINAANRSNY
jgi:hypothetical protein